MVRRPADKRCIHSRCAILAVVLAACGPADAPAVLDVAAASSLRPALEEIAAAYRREHPDAALRPSYGASGALFAQVRNGAPFELLLAADEDTPAALSESAGTAPFAFAVGRLCVWVPGDSTIDLVGRGLQALTDPAVKAIAVANPDHAPYGRAALMALERSGVLAAVHGRLVFGENVGQAAQFGAGGGADAAFVALAQARAPEMRRRGRHWVVPAELHPGLRHAGIVLRREGQPGSAAAAAFVAFLRGQQGRAILLRHGYGPVED